ncbi:MSHA biogenesis protein MshI [Candidatus Pelagadaptatus aseana]|uniref:MSHA biogenesis protein MshI n=1 Tax=Candidatus Pelagadaptatus aseana TaxID=3120508 RepID=UPI003C6F51FA
MSLKSLLNRFKSSQNAGALGLGMCPDGFSVARFTPGAEGPTLKQCDFLLNMDGAPPVAELKNRVHDYKLQGADCHVCLPVSEYNLLLVEAPKVPEEELREAIRWKVKDLLPYPLEEAAIDVFPLPPESSRGRNMVYAVAMPEAEVLRIKAMLDEVGLKLASLGIMELALRNLTEQIVEDERGICLVYLKQNRGLLVLLKGSSVFLSRQFDVNYNAGLFDELPEDQLILELQRSLDYYERQMGQAPPGKILFCGENVSGDKITETLQGAFRSEVAVLDVSPLTGAEVFESSLLNLALPAIGAAMTQGGNS